MGGVEMQKKCMQAKFRMILMVHKEFLNNFIKGQENEWAKVKKLFSLKVKGLPMAFKSLQLSKVLK